MTLYESHVRDVVEMLQRKSEREGEAEVRVAALRGDIKALKIVRKWDREDGARPFPRDLPDGSEVKSLNEVASMMGVARDIAARYVLHTPDLHKGLYAEAVKELHAMKNTDFSGSSIIMLRPNFSDARRIAMEGGEDYMALHVTMGYFSEELRDGEDRGAKKNALMGIAARVCREFPPFEARLNGLTRFSGKDEDALVINVDSPIVEKMRSRIVELAEKKGLPLDRTHGFTPHMTIGYLDKHERSPLDRWSDQECLFPEIDVRFGNSSSNIFALNGQKIDSKDVWGGSVGSQARQTQEGVIRPRRRPRAAIIQRRQRPGVIKRRKTPLEKRICDLKDES